jgi:hypothetical protein
VRVTGQGHSREQDVAEFPTTVAGLPTLRDWLAAFGVGQVVIEATGVYQLRPHGAGKRIDARPEPRGCGGRPGQPTWQAIVIDAVVAVVGYAMYCW